MFRDLLPFSVIYEAFLKTKEETADLSKDWIKHYPPEVLNCNSVSSPDAHVGIQAEQAQRQLDVCTWIFVLAFLVVVFLVVSSSCCL